jgi:hypothetical protein
VTDLLQHRIESAIGECEAHIARIEGAANRLEAVFPLTAETLTALSDENVALLDQFIYRFTKLQDAIGSRLFPAMAVLVIGNEEPRPFLDTLNQLEKAGALESLETWQTLRVLRNSLAHEYPDSVAQCAETLNILYVDWRQLRAIFDTAHTYFRKRLLPLLQPTTSAQNQVRDAGR